MKRTHLGVVACGATIAIAGLSLVAGAEPPKAVPKIGAIPPGSLPAPAKLNMRKLAVLSPALSPKQRDIMSKLTMLSTDRKRELLKAAGVLNPGIGETVVLTVRRPYVSTQAFMSFIDAVAVNPAESTNGIVAIKGANRGDSGLLGALVTVLAAQTFSHGAVVVDFLAKANTDYVVECSWAPWEPPPSDTPQQNWGPVTPQSFYTLGADGLQAFGAGLTAGDGYVAQVVHAKPTGQRIVIYFKADFGWISSGCGITPTESASQPHPAPGGAGG